MKVTIDLPDDLYRRVKAQAALAGRSVREVTTELYGLWLGDVSHHATSASAADWLNEWVSLGTASLGESATGATASELLAADRSCLDRS